MKKEGQTGVEEVEDINKMDVEKEILPWNNSQAEENEEFLPV